MQLTGQVFGNYILELVIYVAALFAILAIGWSASINTSWQPSSIYYILQWVKEWIIAIMIILILVGWIIITLRFMTRPLRYLDELVDASEPKRWNRKRAGLGLLISLALMTAEGFALHAADWQRHDSMHVMLPIVDRICMDQALIDISELEDDMVKTGDVVTLIGTDGNEMLTAADMAETAGTITNEILSRLGSRLERYIRWEMTPTSIGTPLKKW